MPSLTIVCHNRLEVLADALMSRLEMPGQRPENPFTPLRISVPDNGIGTWLHRRLATSLGIAAHIDLDFPNTLLNSLMSGNAEERQPWQDAGLDWALLQVLSESTTDRTDPRLEPLRRYLRQTEGPEDSHRTLGRPSVALAHELAQLFDRYVAYRPDLSRRWTSGQLGENERHGLLAWQPALWEKVVTLLGDPRRLGAVIEVSQTEPVRFFAPTDFSPIALEHIQTIAQQTSVELYCLVHSKNVLQQIEAWNSVEWAGERRSDFDAHISLDIHSFYAASGTLERDLLIQLAGIDGGTEGLSFLHPGLSGGSGTDSHIYGNSRHLTAVQSAICGHESPVPIQFDHRDKSVSVHRCHGPRRQVEVLHDVLRRRFEDFDDLQPRDVLVLVPNMTLFAPVIDAVFLTADVTPRADGQPARPPIPHAVVGQGVRRLNPIADVLLRVLQLGESQSRFEATAVLDLLSFQPVLARFELAQDDVNTIQKWVVDSGVRWGMDGAHHRAFSVGEDSLPEDDQNSWKFGLERLLLGVVLADEAETLFDASEAGSCLPVRPIDDMEGELAVLVGRFADFVNTLMVVVGELAQPRTPKAWFDYILGADDEPGLIPRLVDSADGFGHYMRRAFSTLEGFRQTTIDTADAALLTIDGIRGFLEHKLDSVERGYQTGQSAVTFAPIHSHARVPARLVVLLGFDADAFPRGPRHHQFDLTVVDSRIGDKAPGLADRARFLDAVMSAREGLVVLYTGFDLHTNEEVPPSIVVSELLDAASSSISVADMDFSAEEETQRSVSDFLTQSHPLQAFSPQAFDADPAKAWSYDPNLLNAAQASLNQARDPWCFFELGDELGLPTEPKKDVEEVIRLEELIAFFKAPGEQFLRRQFKMYASRNDAPIRDREPVEIAGGLERWAVGNAMLSTCLLEADRSFDDIQSSPAIRRHIATGTLPWGAEGERVLRNAHEQMQTNLDELRDLIELDSPLSDDNWSEPEDVEIDFSIDGRAIRLVARLDTIRENYLVCLNANSGGSPRRRHHLSAAWLKGLALAASKPSRSVAVVYCYMGGSKTDIEAYVPSELEECFGTSPRDELENALRLFLRGTAQPVPFFSLISHDLAWNLRAHQLPYEEWLVGGSDNPKMEKQRLSALNKVRAGWSKWCSESVASMLFDAWDPIVLVNDELFFDRELYELAGRFWWPAFATRRTKKKILGCV